MASEIGDQLAVMTALAEPLRRALYLYVVAQRRPVSAERPVTTIPARRDFLS
jgi:hypothetical protein